MKDRGMIKWQPFDSVFSSKKMVQNVIWEKSKVSKPCLSEEQMAEIEEKIWEGFHNQVRVTICYFFQNQYYKKQNMIISAIQLAQKRLLLSDHSLLYFDQIIWIQIS